MKFDMSGAGSVLGTIRALAGMQAPVNVIGVDPDLREHARRRAPRAGRHRHHACRARRSRSSTPTPRAA